MSAAPVGVTSSPAVRYGPRGGTTFRSRHVYKLHGGRRGRRQRPLSRRYDPPSTRQGRRIQFLDAQKRQPGHDAHHVHYRIQVAQFVERVALSVDARLGLFQPLQDKAGALLYRRGQRASFHHSHEVAHGVGAGGAGLVGHGDQRAADDASMHHVRFEREPVHREFRELGAQVFERQSRVEQRAQQHVAACSTDAVQISGPQSHLPSVKITSSVPARRPRTSTCAPPARGRRCCCIPGPPRSPACRQP